MTSKEEVKKEIARLIEKYEKVVSDGREESYNEDMTKNDFIEPLFEVLGWDVRNKFTIDEMTLEEKISRKKVDYAFRINSLIKFFVETKSLKVDIDDTGPIKQAINYAYTKGIRWIVLTNFKELTIFNAEWKKKSVLDNRFITIKYKDFLKDFDDLWLISKEGIIDGLLNKKAEKYAKIPLKKPIDQQLLSDLILWRNRLSEDILKRNKKKKLNREQIDESVQRILDRLIFIRKCEDSELEEKKLMEIVHGWDGLESRKRLINSLKNVFGYFDDNYDSKIFQKHLCDYLDVNDMIIEDIIYGLYYTKDKSIYYNFADIDADVLGNIYEQYLGHILRTTVDGIELTDRKNHRKSQGIYYTPTYIVDYIVRNTLGELLKENKVDKIKILDPACGSGSFLIKSFDYLVEYLKDKIKEEDLNFIKKSGLTTNNIFGVDLDPQAVEIAQLNLLLKMAESKRQLPMLQENIKCGNSLIDDEKISPKYYFEWEKEFPKIIQYDKNGNLKEDCGFDVIIGNPPYILMQPRNTTKQLLDYIKNRYKVAQYKIDTYHLFFERAISLLKDGGYFGFITPNTYFMNIYTSNLRKYILDNCKILKIVIIPEEVFPDASVDTAITILQKDSNETSRRNNKIEVLKIEDFAHGTYKNIAIKQNDFFEEENYIFNVNISDEENRLIKKLIKNSIPLGKISRVSFGLQTKNKKTYVKNKPMNKQWKPCINGGDISRYNLKFGSQYFLHDIKIKAGGCWDESTYNTAEKIVIRQIGVTPIATLDTDRFYCLNTIYKITSLNNNFNYRYVLAIINSKLIKFFWKIKFYDSKLLFPKIKKAYLDCIPIKKISMSKQLPLINLVDKMVSLNKQLNKIGNKKTDEQAKIEGKLKGIDKEIDDLVYKIYDISEEEKKIIEQKLK